MKQNNSDEKPPLFKTWKQWYWAVAISLILYITSFTVFTKVFE